MGRGSSGIDSKNMDYRHAYNDEIGNPNYRYLSFEAAVNSTNREDLKRQIMAQEMRMSEDMRGESALKTMNDELNSIKKSLRENHQLAKAYGLSPSTEKGIRDGLKEHKSRIEKVIGLMRESRSEMEKQKTQLRKNRNKKWI